MNKRLIGGAFVTACSLVALAGYVDRASGDMSYLTDSERALVSRMASVIKGSDFILEASGTDDLSEFADADGSRLAPLEDVAPPVDPDPAPDPAEDTGTAVTEAGNVPEKVHAVLLPEETALPAPEAASEDDGAVMESDPATGDFVEEKEWIDVTDVLVAMSQMSEEEREAFLERGRLAAPPAGDTYTEVEMAEDFDPASVAVDEGEESVADPELELLEEEVDLDAPEAADGPAADDELSPVAVAEALPAEAAPAALPAEDAGPETLSETGLSAEDVEWAKLHNKDLVTLFDHITGYPFQAIEGETPNIPFTLPMAVEAPGAVLIRAYEGQEHLPQRYPGWCVTMISFADSDWNRYHWLHEGAKPQAEGRLAEVVEQVHGERIIPQVVGKEILDEGEFMVLNSVCLDGVWEGLAPLEHSSLFRVLSGQDFGEDFTMIQAERE